MSKLQTKFIGLQNERERATQQLREFNYATVVNYLQRMDVYDDAWQLSCVTKDCIEFRIANPLQRYAKYVPQLSVGFYVKNNLLTNVYVYNDEFPATDDCDDFIAQLYDCIVAFCKSDDTTIDD